MQETAPSPQLPSSPQPSEPQLPQPPFNDSLARALQDLGSDVPSLNDTSTSTSDSPASESGDAPSVAEPVNDTEAKVEAPAVKEEPKVAAKFAALHKKAKELFTKEQELKALEAKYADIESAKDEPAKLLQLLGYDSLEALLERFAKDGGISTQESKETRELRKRLDALEAEKRAEAERIQKETQEREQREKLDKQSKEIAEFLKSNSEKYELLQVEGAHQEVLNEILRHEQATWDPDLGEGEVLDYDTAAKRVEDGLTTVLKKLLGTKRALALVAEVSSKSPNQSGTASHKAPNTIIGQTMSVSSAPHSDGDLPSDEELLAQSTAWLQKRRNSR